MDRIITFRQFLILTGIWSLATVVLLIINPLDTPEAFIGAAIGAAGLYFIGNPVTNGDSE